MWETGESACRLMRYLQRMARKSEERTLTGCGVLLGLYGLSLPLGFLAGEIGGAALLVYAAGLVGLTVFLVSRR
jgi:hypothetical protein